MSKSPAPDIECTPGVCGGDACVARTRIPVWVLVRAHQLGGSDEDILEDYPTLCHDDLDNAWAYYELHRAHIDQQIADNESLELPERPQKGSKENQDEHEKPYIRPVHR